MLYQCVSLVCQYFLMSENKSVFNWTFCQLLTEKPNCTKIASDKNVVLLFNF